VASESAARAGVRANEAGVDLAEISLSYTRIIAPIDGLIGISKARPGEFVGRELNPVVLNTLSDVDPIRVRFSISESEYLILLRTYFFETEVASPDDIIDAEDSAVITSRKNKPDLQLLLLDCSEHPCKGKPMNRGTVDRC